MQSTAKILKNKCEMLYSELLNDAKSNQLDTAKYAKTLNPRLIDYISSQQEQHKGACYEGFLEGMITAIICIENGRTK